METQKPPRLAKDQLIVLQSADAYKYYDMLIATARTAREFCNRWGATYECYIGVKRGFWNWQATYNRITLLNELYARGHRSWVLYLDADAYVRDQSFGIDAYLKSKARYGAIMVPSGATSALWDVNAGVIFVNLGHRTGVEIVKRWVDAFQSIPDAVLRKNETPFSGPEDQFLLHNILRNDETLWPDIHLESQDTLNSAHASFIRQMLRAMNQDFASRLAAVREAVDRVMAPIDNTPKATSGPLQKTETQKIVSACYKAILKRDADRSGLEGYGELLELFGTEKGLENILDSLTRSEEYLSRRR